MDEARINMLKEKINEERHQQKRDSISMVPVEIQEFVKDHKGKLPENL